MGDTDEAMDIRDRCGQTGTHVQTTVVWRGSMSFITFFFGSATDIRSDPESENGKLDYVVVVAPVARNISLL